MQQLFAIMKQLRAECPWDREQTPESLTRYAIEEAYEVEEAVRSGDIDEIKNELGDLLLQVVFQSQMYSEQGAFDFNDVVDVLCQKLIRRHPHVFQKQQFDNLTPEQVSVLWQEIKQQEKQGKAQSRLDAVKHGPALSQAAKRNVRNIRTGSSSKRSAGSPNSLKVLVFISSIALQKSSTSPFRGW